MDKLTSAVLLAGSIGLGLVWSQRERRLRPKKVKKDDTPHVTPFNLNDHRDAILKRVEIIAKALNKDADTILNSFPHLKNGASYQFRPYDYGGAIGNTLDQSILKQTQGYKDLRANCEDAHKYKFKAICIHPTRIQEGIIYLDELAKRDNTTRYTKVITVVGFPLGHMTTASKVHETQEAIALGAEEIDMVLHIGHLLDQDYKYVWEDIVAVVNVSKQKGIPVKVILENCLLTQDQIIDGCLLSVLAGAQFVKTSTGFSTGGAKPEDIKLMKAVVGDQALVKAAGGVRSYPEALVMVNCGAARIGTSAGVVICQGSGTSTASY